MQRHTGPNQLVRRGNIRRGKADSLTQCELPESIATRLVRHLGTAAEGGDDDALTLLRSLMPHMPIQSWDGYQHLLRGKPAE